MLTDAQVDRYSRHILLREVGVEGQERLQALSCAVPRLDDEGRSCLLWLARSGVGTLVIPADETPAPSSDASGLLLPEDAGVPVFEAVSARLKFHDPSVHVRIGPVEGAREVDPTGGAMAALAFLVRGLA